MCINPGEQLLRMKQLVIISIKGIGMHITVVTMTTT